MERIKLWQLTQYLEDKAGCEGGLIKILVDGETHETEGHAGSAFIKSFSHEWEVVDIKIVDDLYCDLSIVQITVQKPDKANENE